MKQYDQDGYLMSASMAGEDRWSEVSIVSDQLPNGLIPGHSYTIVAAKDAKNYRLIQLRNPWGNFEWTGEWSDTSQLWTSEIKSLLSYTPDVNDGTFWMSYFDFIKNFNSLNTCKIKNWDEVRIKGKFVRVEDVEDQNVEVVMSKWYYSLEVTEPTNVIVGIH
jgi:calpain-15